MGRNPRQPGVITQIHLYSDWNEVEATTCKNRMRELPGLLGEPEYFAWKIMGDCGNIDLICAIQTKKYAFFKRNNVEFYLSNNRIHFKDRDMYHWFCLTFNK